MNSIVNDATVLFTSKKHAAHGVVDILDFIEKKNKTLQADIEELGKIIYPKYQEIASSFSVQKDDLNGNTEKLISAITKRGEDWHREIDNIIRKLKSDIEKTESENVSVIKKQEVKINNSLSEITHSINELKKLLDSNDANLLSTYKSRNAEFRRLPPKLVITLPHFSPQRIDTDQLFQQFGSLTALSITTEEISHLEQTKMKKYSECEDFKDISIERCVEKSESKSSTIYSLKDNKTKK